MKALLESGGRERELLGSAIGQLNTIVLGKDREIRLAIACLLARGHLLIEDIPGVGKTTLAHALARVLGLTYQRIQFTSDLLPADVIGVSVYDRGTGSFQFHRGPVFAQLVLADEVNRATPKAQSALLEAMEERQVTMDGVSHPLPEPFFVVATQNPSYQVGTFPLPESQLDRFLMRVALGYPAASHERALLRGRDRRDLLAGLPAVLDPEVIVSLQQQITGLHASDALIDYVQALVRASRDGSQFLAGLSTRAAISLLRAAQAWAYLHGHAGVLPEDLQSVLPSVVGHRLRPREATDLRGPNELARALLEAVPIP
jgi:MoxR-like ATPase